MMVVLRGTLSTRHEPLVSFACRTGLTLIVACRRQAQCGRSYTWWKCCFSLAGTWA